jgi:hypothetical protein
VKFNPQRIPPAKRKRKRLAKGEILENFGRKQMQTLTAGSFLNLESAEKVEALKFTARRLAEHSASVVPSVLNAAALGNLALNLWEKAAYVTRENERQRLRQIFVENFGERFRELKPADAISTEKSVSEISAADSPKEAAPVAVEGEKDEFLGFVKTDEPPSDVSVEENRAQSAGEPEKIEQSGARAETVNSENQIADVTGQAESTTATENSAAVKTETPPAVAPHVESKPQPVAASAGKPNTQTPNEKEPFEFEKCTINLNVTLMPAEPGKETRKVIVGTVSHNLPPEIDFLEINEGGDLTQIAGLVREKLARFKQTLPVKYIEQLRASKNNSAKKLATAKTTPALALARSETGEDKAEETSGEQNKREEGNGGGALTGKPLAEATVEKNSAAASTAMMPTVNQSGAANSLQGSLF